MRLTYTEKARKYINEHKGDFCMQQVADAVGCEREKISHLTHSLQKENRIEFVGKRLLIEGGYENSFYKRIKPIRVIQKGAAIREPIIIDTKSPWHKFCFNKKAA